jgi:hypothetical protein
MWKTVSARIRGADTELKEMGEDTDGMVTSSSKLQALIKGMTGFDIMESDGKTFKDIYDIIIGIGEKWNDLSDINRASLLEKLAGKNQSNALAAAISQVDVLKKSYKEATNAEGSAREENEEYAKSIQASIDLAQAKLEELANDILSSNFLKSLIDSGGTALDIINGLFNGLQNISSLGGNISSLGGILGTVGGLVQSFTGHGAVKYDSENGWSGIIVDIYKAKKGIVDLGDEFKKFKENANSKGWNFEYFYNSHNKDEIEQWIKQLDLSDESLKKFLKDWDGSGDIQEAFTAHMKESTEGLTIFQRAGKAAGTAMRTLGATLGSMAVSWAIGEAISLAISGIDHLVNYEKYQEQAFENATETAQKYADEIKSVREENEKTVNSANEISLRYAELVQGVDANTNKNESLSNDDYKEFLDLNKQLADLFPTLTKGYDENGNAILGLSGGVDTVTESIRKLVEQQQRLAKQDLKDNLEKYVNGDDESEGQLKSIEGQKKKVDELNEEINAYKKVYDSIVNGKDIVNPKENGETLNEAFRSIKENTDIGRDWNASVVTHDKNGNYTINYGNTIKLSKDEKEKIEEGYKTLLDDLVGENQTAQDELDSKNKELSQQMMIWVGDTSLYKDNKTLQEPLNNLVSNIDWGSLGLDDYAGVQSFIQKNILTPLSTACKDPNLKAQVFGAFSSLLSTDFSKLSLTDANEQIDSLLNTIVKAVFPKLEGNELQKKIDEYRKSFGLDDYKDSQNRLTNNIGTGKKDKDGNIKGIAKNADEVQQLTRYTKEFNQEQAEAWLNATQGAENADDAIRRYESSIKSASKAKPVAFDKAWDGIDDSTQKSLFDAANSAELTGDKLLDLAKDNETLKEAFDSTKMSAEDFATAIRELNIDNIETDINDCSEALNKMKNGQSLSATETAKLISKNSSLAGSIKKTKDGYKIEKDALISVMNSSKEKYNVVVSNEILETNKVIDSTKKRIKAYYDEIDALTSVMEARQSEYNSLTNNGTKKDSYGLDPDETSRAMFGSGIEYSQLKKAEGNLKKNKKKLKEYKKRLKELKSSLKNITSASGSGSSGGGSKSKSKSSNSTVIDWIERKLDRLNTKLDLVKAKYDNLPSSSKSSAALLNAENKNLDDQIKILKKVQSVNNKSYSKYMKKANSVGLSSSLKKKVRNGQIKGSYKKLVKAYGEKTANKIQKYQDYYDKAQSSKKNSQDAKKSITDAKVEKLTNAQNYYDTLNAMNQAYESTAKGLSKNNYVQEQIKATKQSYNYQIKIAKAQGDYNKKKQLEQEKEKAILDLQRQKVENIKTFYDNQVGLLDNDKQDIQNQIDLIEARGDIVSKGYYKNLTSEDNAIIAKREAELKDLKSQLSTTDQGTDNWYELQNDIQSVENEINDHKKSVYENTKAIGELNDKMYEAIYAISSNLNAELDTISSLKRGEVSDSDTGTLTDTGFLQLYAAGLSYSATKGTAAEANARLAEIIKANKNGKVLEGYTSLQAQKDAEAQLAKDAQDQVTSVKSYGDKIIEIIKDAISSVADHLQEIIDARKEALNEEKDLRDYERSILEKTKNVSSLQKQFMAVSGDTSEEGRLKAAQLRKSLDEAQQDLQDTEYDRYISDQQEMLDNMMNQFQDLMEKLQKDEDALLREGIKAINDQKGVMQQIFNKTAEEYGYPTSTNLTELQTALTTGRITADIINSAKDDSVTSVIKTEAEKIVKAYGDAKSGTGGGTPSTGGNNSNSSNDVSNVKNEMVKPQYGGGSFNLEEYTGTTKTENSSQTLIEQAVKNLVGMGGTTYWKTKQNPSSKTNQTIKNKKWNDGKILTEKGGYALYNDLIDRKLITGKKNKQNKKGNNTISHDTLWAALNKAFTNAGFATGGIAKLVKPAGEDGIGWMRNGEGLVAPENVQDIRDLMDVTPDLTKLVTSFSNLPNVKPLDKNVTRNVSIDNITFDMPNVTNATDFTDTIKKPEQQKAFAAAIGDAFNGKKLNINRY